MDSEEKELLHRSVDLAEENNKILRALHRSMRIRRFMSVIYWVLIIGSTIGLFYFLQPYVDQITNFWQESADTVNSFKSFLPKSQ
ncbi:MAG TPA: hypothetical protein VJB95_02775 [Candidatus Paceibacterota bacterium]